MTEFLSSNLYRVIATLVLLASYPVIRHVLNRLLSKYSDFTQLNRTRSMMIKKTLNFLLGLILVIVLITLWGVRPQNIFLTLSSIFAVIGVALFAQWSILSNITAGFILFFSLHIKIGDKIEILDKDFPIIAEVEDIKTFYTYLRGDNCKRYVYPNNLLLQKGISILNNEKNPIIPCEEDDH